MHLAFVEDPKVCSLTKFITALGDLTLFVDSEHCTYMYIPTHTHTIHILYVYTFKEMNTNSLCYYVTVVDTDFY